MKEYLEKRQSLKKNSGCSQGKGKYAYNEESERYKGKFQYTASITGGQVMCVVHGYYKKEDRWINECKQKGGKFLNHQIRKVDHRILIQWEGWRDLKWNILFGNNSTIVNFDVSRVLINGDSSCDIMYADLF